MCKISVINKKDERHYTDEQKVYVGRPSPLGNPFVMKNKHDAKEREQVVLQYRDWLTERIAEQDPKVVTELRRIGSLTERHEVALVCWCAPLGCHADVIADVIRKQFSK